MSEPAPACAWCGAPFGERPARLPGRLVCTACGVATTDPWPSDDELERAYGDWYRPASGRFAGLGDGVLRRSRATLARRLDRIAPPGPVLDVGAGDGVLLDALRALGRDATGLERRSGRPDVLEQDVLEVRASYAAVVFWHSVEHLREPGRALDHAATLLAPRGVLVVAMPNAGSLQAKTFGARWFALDMPRHLVHVPARALVSRLRAAGLRVERQSHLRGGQVAFGWLHGMIAALHGSPDLYEAIRRPEARRSPMGPGRRAAVLGLAAVLAPMAALAAAAEALVRRGGTVYVEARRG